MINRVLKNLNNVSLPESTKRIMVESIMKIIVNNMNSRDFEELWDAGADPLDPCGYVYCGTRVYMRDELLEIFLRD